MSGEQRDSEEWQPRIQISKAFQHVNLIDDHNHTVLLQPHHPKSPSPPRESPPEEVNHEIEEVGIMAIKEVRYVTEREWEKMIALQKDQKEIWDYLERISKYGQRSKIATSIPRNRLGQFSKKSHTKPAEESQQPAPRQKRVRKGRPRKGRSDDED